MATLTIKVECECGTRYKFDVAPVDGRMPVEVICPHCGSDGTDKADRLIEIELARLSGAPVPPKIELPKPFKVEAEKTAFQVTGKRPPQHTVTLPPQVKKPGLGHPCPKHPKETTVNGCLLCKRPICQVCMSKYGYFCSTTCRHEAEQRGMEIPVYQGQESLVRERKHRRTKRLIIGTAALVVAICVLWAWYAFFGSQPQMNCAVNIDKADHLDYCRFAGPGPILLKPDRVLSLYDTRGLKPIWSISLALYQKPLPTLDELPTAGEIEAEFRKEQAEFEKTGKRPERKWKSGLDELRRPSTQDEFLSRFSHHTSFRSPRRDEGRVQLRGGEIWVLFSDSLVVFDRKTGKEKKKVALRGQVLQLTPDDSVIFVTSTGRPNEGQLTRIAFRTGDGATDKITLPEPKRLTVLGDTATPLLGGMAAGTEQEAEREKAHETRFIPAGVNVARLEIEMIQENIVTRQTVKPEDIKPKEEPGSKEPLKVTDALEFAKQLRYEAVQSRGGVFETEDESRYRVSLRRHMMEGTPEWTGEVIGPPTFIPLNSVDVLVSSKSITVFDKENEKLWDAPLAFPAGSVSVDFGDGAKAPCCEAGNTLYLYDSQALTSFELVSGKVRWRMPLPGVESIRLDGDGMLYVTNPESVSKVDPETGKVLWKLDKKDVRFFLSGKYVYLSKAQVSGADMIRNLWTGKEIPTHFRIFRVDPKTGQILWEFYRPKEPAAMDFENNRIVLLFPTEYRKDPKNPTGRPLVTPGELEILRYLTF